MAGVPVAGVSGVPRDLPSLAQLLETLDSRVPFEGSGGKSGARLERATRGGERFVLKYLDRSGDWVARATGELVPRVALMWARGLIQRLPEGIDTAIVDCAYDEDSGIALLLLHDVGSTLVRAKAPVGMREHRRFLRAMARLHASFWDFQDDCGLLPLSTRYEMLSLPVAEVERARGEGHAVPEQLMPRGWSTLETVAPEAAVISAALLADLGPLLEQLERSPMTLVHGDWKLDNLGSHPDGRTVLLDWALPGRAPGLAELAWYLCTSGGRLPESKDQSIEAYREALETAAVATGGWYEEQLDLALLGTFLILGWQLALGDPAELRWWETAVLRAASRLP